ncbi:hypothetical protein B9Z35_11980 [Limnohabitans sp. Jir61]|nr:hypothetical protein B9Z35_11980 [Limnohabitans sp. Jir61]
MMASKKMLGHFGLAWCCVIVLAWNSGHALAQHNRHAAVDAGGAISRMEFKEGKKNPKEPSCKLTLMHIYTSKFNKKHTQFAFTGSVVAKREKGKEMVLSVIGQNHQMSPTGKEIKPFDLPRIELGIEDASVRRYSEHKQKCKKGYVCAEYKDTKKRELQTWISDDKKSLNLLFPLVTKQPSVVIDLSKFAPPGKDDITPLAQFKACTAHLK